MYSAHSTQIKGTTSFLEMERCVSIARLFEQLARCPVTVSPSSSPSSDPPATRNITPPQPHTVSPSMSSQMSPTSSPDPVDPQNGPSHDITETQRAQHITALQVVFAGFVASAKERGVGLDGLAWPWYRPSDRI